MSNDETKTEDINRKWRPSTIKERYSHLSFQTAGQLKAKMKELMGNSDKSSMAFLDRVFCTVYLVSSFRDIVLKLCCLFPIFRFPSHVCQMTLRT